MAPDSPILANHDDLAPFTQAQRKQIVQNPSDRMHRERKS